jgi:hypothetical protein
MKRISFWFTLVVTAFIGTTTFVSCEKEECEVCDVCTEIPTDIKDYEKTIIARFKIPEGKTDVSVHIEAIVYTSNGLDEDGDGIEDFAYSIQSFSIEDKGVTGHSKNIMTGGDPVPGIEVLVEQEPNDDPVTNATVNEDGGLNISIDHLDPGTYQIRVESPDGSGSSKAGFAVGGYSAT